METNAASSAESNRSVRARTAGLILALVTLCLYLPAARFEFNNYDDAQYLTKNRHVQGGLTQEDVVWAFTKNYASNWHPLTWISHQLDWQIFGANAGGHHLVSVLFHVVNTLLLFVLLERLTGQMWRAAFVAAVFAWHPLHVESVAWVAERKDVLSTFFFLLTLLAYARYAQAEKNGAAGVKMYLLALFLFALGLMSKPMLVTLPCLLLLLDYWPLERISLSNSGNADARVPEFRTRWLKLLLEKIPFFILSAASCVVTVLAQKAGHSVQSLGDLPLTERLANALVSYARYLGKIFWPVDLAVIYPYTRQLPVAPILGAAALLAIITVAVLWMGRRRKFLVVGWLWYVVTLVPVIGLVQVGGQALADRYTYVPSIGVAIMLAWAMPEIRPWNMVFEGLAVIALVLCLGVTVHQLQFWRNSETLFTRTVSVTQSNAPAQCNLALAFYEQGRTNDALAHLREALLISSNHVESLNNMAFILAGQGRLDEAVPYLERSVRLHPFDDTSHYDLGVMQFTQGRLDEAITNFRAAAQLNPDYDKALANLGIALQREGKVDEAITQYRAALKIAPGNLYAHNALAHALEERNQSLEAATEYALALKLAKEAGQNELAAQIEENLRQLHQ